MATLKSKLRANLMSSHGARKNTRNALWVAYSPKSRADLSLASNNECVYWITHLETDSGVRAFKFGYHGELKFEGEDSFREREAIRVELTNGEIEIHVLSAGDGGIIKSTVILRERFASRAVVEERQVPLVRVYSEYLRQHALKATRMLKLIGFASQIREHKHDITTAAVELAIGSMKAGWVEQILLSLSRHDPMVVLGVFAEKILAGGIEIDLAEHAFGSHSYWKLR
ncbi:hypothetical protein ACVK1X_003134 [Pseudomonas sp. PvR086]